MHDSRKMPVRIIRYGLGIFVVFPLFLVILALAIVLVGVNLPSGQRLIEHRLPQWTGNMVQLEGLSGAIPWNIHLRHLALQDKKGIWLALDNADLRWSPLALLHMDLHVAHLGAAHLAYWRNPVPDAPSAPVTESQSSFSLNLGIRLDKLAVDRIEIGKDVMGQPLLLSVSGEASVQSIAPFMKTITPQTFAAKGPEMRVALNVKRLDSPAMATLLFLHHHRQYQAKLHIAEEKGGFVTTLAEMPALDPLVIDLSAAGSFDHLKTDLALHAGSLETKFFGLIDAVHLAGDMGLEVTAPAMTLKPDLGWDHLALSADIHGPFRRPYGMASLDMVNLNASGSGAGRIQLAFKGDAPPASPAMMTGNNPDDHKGALHLLGTVSGLRVPGKNPLLLASDPVLLDGFFYPERKGQPFEVRLVHSLMQLGLRGNASPAPSGHLGLVLPDLSAWAAMGGVDIRGSARLGADFSLPVHEQDMTKLTLGGDLSVTDGQRQAVALIGDQGHISLNLTRNEAGRVTIQTFFLKGHALGLDARGFLDLPLGRSGGKSRPDMDVTASLSLPALDAVDPVLQGDMTLAAHALGPLDDISLTNTLNAMLGVKHPGVTVPKGPLELALNVVHLPAAPVGHLSLQGILDRVPVDVKADFSRDQAGLANFTLHHLAWKSLKGAGHFILPPEQVIPVGDMELSLQHLEDVRNLAGQAVSGHLDFGIHTSSEQKSKKPAEEQKSASFSLSAQAYLGDYGVDLLGLKGNVKHLPTRPEADISLNVRGIRAKEITGQAKVQLKGPQNALALDLSGQFEHVLEAPARINLSLLLDMVSRQVRLKTFSAFVKGENARILRPVVVDYGDHLAIDRLQLAVAPPHGAAMQLDLGGRIKPDLAVDASLTHLTPALAEGFVPGFRAEGEITAQAKLQGSLTAPRGSVRIEGHGLHMLTEPGASLPSASFNVKTQLDGKMADFLVNMEAGPRLQMEAGGIMPFSPSGALSVAAKGGVDLRLANAILGASAMGVSGRLQMDIHASGPVKRPGLAGRIALENGSFDHYAQGVHLQDINSEILAQDDTLKIQNFSLKAGEGRMGLEGEIGVLRPGLPVDLHFSMEKAQPMRSDMVEEVLDAALHIHGQANTRLDVDGSLNIPTATITIPDSIPASVPQLEIVDPAEEAKASRQQSMIIGLNMKVTSPGALFIRGHGLFAEMQGDLDIGGTSTAPEIKGGFSLRRGNFNLAGINLTFSHGEVSFNGSVTGHKLDPTIEFRADRNADGILASLLVSGYASAPKIDFVSQPERPQDEILAILLFGAPRASLSTVQLAELGAAIVQLGGGKAFDPLGAVRNSLGLDQLTIGGGGAVDNGGTNVEAGKYVMKGVYVGASEGLSGGGGSQAKVRIDLTEHLKLNTVVGTGGQVTGFTTPENDPGSSIGLSYGTDY